MGTAPYLFQANEFIQWYMILFQISFTSREAFFQLLIESFNKCNEAYSRCCSHRNLLFERRREFRVSDEGAGIRKEDQEIIFDREMRLLGTNSYGLGIGLHSVRESLNWINSRCHVESPYLRNVNIHNGKESGEMYGSSFLVHYDRSRVYRRKRKIERIRIMLPKIQKWKVQFIVTAWICGSRISGVELTG